jgi:replicative DNA helicase
MTEQKISRLIIRGLISDEKYARKVLPFVKAEYFEDPIEGILYKKIADIFEKYSKVPPKDALSVAVRNDKTIPEALYSTAQDVVSKLDIVETDDWLVDQTELFCKDRAINNAIIQSIDIIEGNDKKHSKDSLPQILQDALNVGFDNSVGHEYFAEAEERYDFYHNTEQRIPFKIKLLNEVTHGGVAKKTLNIIMAGTNVGKSMMMTDWAAFLVLQGFNVLYVSAEMAEERIGERLDANILNVSISDLVNYGREMFMSKIQTIQSKTKGRLFVKEYATATAHVGHIQGLLAELKIKKGFTPDIIFLDYLNIFCSQRFKVGTDSYTYVKAIAEEVRGLAVTNNVPIVSATQVNRGGYSNTDMDIDDTSESWGLPSTADFFIALIASEELQKLNQQMIKQLKSRYGNPNHKKRFVVGVDPEKQRYYDVESNAQLVGQSVVIAAESGKSAQAVTDEFFRSTRTRPDTSGIKV